MTEQQKKALGEAREIAKKIKGIGQTLTAEGYHLVGGMIRDKADDLAKQFDAIEADGKFKPERQPIYDELEQAQWSAYTCNKCGCKTLEKYPHCPGCGREVEQ